MSLPAPREAYVVVRARSGDPRGTAVAACLAAAGVRHRTADAPDGAAGADAVLACLPWRVLRDEAGALAAAAPDAVLVACTTGLVRDEQGWAVEEVPRGSVLAMLADLLPARRVVGAWQLLDAAQLRDAARGDLATDVPVTGDDADAVTFVSGVVDLVPGLDAVRLGGSRTAGAVEGLAAVLREVAVEPGRAGTLRVGGATPTGLRFS